MLPSNIGLTINSSWNMNGGTNVISNVTTNNNAAASLSVGNNTNNVQVSVNAGATWWLAIPANSISTNTLGLLIGANSATNNVLTVNGGTLIATNKGRDNPGTIQVGASAASTGNQMIITNGGQVFSRADGLGGGTPGYVGINGSYNSLLVAGFTTLLAASFGFVASLWLAGFEKRGRNRLLAVAVTALALPPFLVTNCWLHFLGPAGVWRGWLPQLP